MNPYLSAKISIISLISIVMVVYLHSYNISMIYEIENKSHVYGFNYFIQNFISQGVTRIAVPVFFAISGYLFFLNYRGIKTEYFTKIKKRIKTLAVPFLMWSTISVLVFTLFQLIPATSSLFSKRLFVEFSIAELVHNVIIAPISYQFWFIRDLIILVIISPLLFLLIKYLRSIIVVIFLLIWLNVFSVDFVIFSAEAIFFFVLGGYLSYYNQKFVLKKREQFINMVALITWLVLLVIHTILLQLQYENILFITLIYKSSILIGVFSIWTLYDFVLRNNRTASSTILHYSSFTFFIFAFHEPILGITEKGIFYLMGTNNLILLLTYFLLPFFIIVVSISIAKVLKKNLPYIYRLLTGSR